MPKLNIIICSTRPSRLGVTVAKWFHEHAAQHAGFECELVDLAEFDLPVFNEPEHPRLRKYQHEHTKKWSASVQSADAFVFVLPEYNYAPPPAFFNALDYLVSEWHYKPAGFVGYGGISGGMRAIQMAKQMITTFKVMPMTETVNAINFSQSITSENSFEANDLHKQSATAMLDELRRWTDAMQQLRAPRN